MFRLNVFGVKYNRCLTRTVSVVWFDEHSDARA
jgi:phage terminase large subunit-like protein